VQQPDGQPSDQCVRVCVNQAERRMLRSL